MDDGWVCVWGGECVACECIYIFAPGHSHMPMLCVETPTVGGEWPWISISSHGAAALCPEQ